VIADVAIVFVAACAACIWARGQKGLDCLRIEVIGGLYHVTSRCDRREAIYLDDATVSRVVRAVKVEAQG